MVAATMSSALTTVPASLARRPTPRVQAQCRPSAFFRPGYGFNRQCQPNAWRTAARRYGQGRMSQQDIDEALRMTDRFIRDVAQMVDAFSGDYRRTQGAGSGAGPEDAQPEADADMPLAVDVTEDAFSFMFTADVPGVQRSAAKVQARKDERELVISGERPAPEQSEEEKGFRRRVERRFGKFSRTFSLPENAELTGITARFENGVLTVRVPKAIPVEPEVTEIPIADGDDNTIDI